MEPQEFNEGASCIPKRQERDLDSLKDIYTVRGDVKWVRRSYHHIEILLSSQGVGKKNLEGLLWG